MMNQTREIPVYLFTGFLDAGKTSFIQETLEDPAFNDGQKTLVLVCEEGEEEFSPIKFASSGCKIITIDDEEELTESYLSGLQKEIGFERVVVEYNGMWLLDTFYQAMPQSWVVYQEMTFADARTYLTYNANMRNLVVDKIKSTETIVFKHFTAVMDKMAYHKIVRALNRRCDIIYEYGPNNIEIDNIEDPLPFDLNADLIVIEDRDYAVWYSDMNDEEAKYYGKTVKFRGRSLLGGGLKPDEFVIGRHIMTCCAEDIQFGGLVAKYADSQSLEHGGWVEITAKIEKEYNDMYQSEGPVYHVLELKKIPPIADEVATFY